MISILQATLLTSIVQEKLYRDWKSIFFPFWNVGIGVSNLLDTPNDPSKVMTFAAVVNIAGNASSGLGRLIGIIILKTFATNRLRINGTFTSRY